MNAPVVTVFGGTGFLGQRTVSALLDAGARVRVAARHVPSGAGAHASVEPVKVDVRDERSVERAVSGARAVVNVVALYVEQPALTFEDVHVHGAATVARQAREAGAAALVHVSGIGADPDSPSAYVRARGEGEGRVAEAFPSCTVLRPSVLFGRGDGFVNLLDQITRSSPVFPLFGDGATRLAPVHVDDVANAIARIALSKVSASGVHELGGGQILTYRRCVEQVLATRRRRRLILPCPLALWRVVATGLSWMSSPPVTHDQIALIGQDNVPSAALPGFPELGITPRRLDEALAECLDLP